MRILRADTQVVVPIGPAVAVADGFTPVTTLTLGAADEAELIKHDTTTNTDISGNTFGVQSTADGWFGLTLTAGNTDTEGLLTVVIHDDSLILPIYAYFMVVNANVYDSLYKAAATAYLKTDVTKVSGDATAANNLELQFDGTGYVGDTAPATQSQLASVTNVGSAVSVHPKAEPNGFVITVGGTETNDEDSTFALDGTKHTLADNGSGVLDCYYEFDIGAGIPTSVTHKGYITGNNDDVGVYGYNWVTTAWVQIGTLEGKASATVEVNSYDMFTNMVGSAANEGTVRIRFYAASGLSTALLATDQILLSFSRGNEGYEDGAIWIDTNYSNTGTVVGIDGTSRNPVSTIAAANTLSASTNLNVFHIAPGSAITFAASQDDQIFMGHDWTLALGGQSISGSYIEGAKVSGIATGASAPTFVECNIGTVTLPPCELRRCGFTATITGGSAGDFHFNGCFSEVAGAGTPTFDFGTAVANTNLNMRHWSGGIQLEAMGNTGTDMASIEGWGQVVEGTCTGGTVVIRGNFTTSGITNLTLSDDARIDVSQVGGSAWDGVMADHVTVGTFGELQCMLAKWEITTGNQLKLFDLAGTLKRTFDLTRGGDATSFNPDKRTPA